MFEIIVIFGLLIFVLILVSPLVLIYWLGANPEKQNLFKNFLQKNRKVLLILILLFGVVFNVNLLLEVINDGYVQTYIDSLFDVFVKYFTLGIIFLFFMAIVELIKKSKQK